MVDVAAARDLTRDLAVVDEVHPVDQREHERDVLLDEQQRNPVRRDLADRHRQLVLELG
ncbi:hypothetical protein HK436_06540 [Mesorhizobium sediminum]|nr:hypothetical protein [Mesorhizobium sediminum]